MVGGSTRTKERFNVACSFPMSLCAALCQFRFKCGKSNLPGKLNASIFRQRGGILLDWGRGVGPGSSLTAGHWGGGPCGRPWPEKETNRRRPVLLRTLTGQRFPGLNTGLPLPFLLSYTHSLTFVSSTRIPLAHGLSLSLIT